MLTGNGCRGMPNTIETGQAVHQGHCQGCLRLVHHISHESFGEGDLDCITAWVAIITFVQDQV